ncbi:hypothetical protein CMT42_15345 [Elizabethkingia anophelis]|uniref:HNH nuclease domain-containing protein n=1 Tax=Elizabethkingia anophelis TaxID=1117645 RepID=A0A494J1U8_9FLAO|nr:HNH endonuclease [Elizabethkingia anophelis]AQX52547.1 hypothetical protein AYC66_18495 [Elizabethkingia anophelis]MDV3917907.1 hypothetical protein [Elizabethkingia anophelis]MDV3920618.1 hypothetical protein [Elizabethkingia anophelis]MDV3934981.1 hypothetical protein [Elizabethkingia anophelis]MDV3992927.1 hypothetical protein [Elizabethkingia anophelis]
MNNPIPIKYRIQYCEQCDSTFTAKSIRKYCCQNCYYKSKELIVFCKLCGDRIINKHSVSIHNRLFCSKKCQNKSRQGVKLSDEWKKKLSEGRKNSEKCKGPNLYNWKGGKKTLLFRMKLHRIKRQRSLKIDIDKKFLFALLIAQKNRCFYCEKEFKKDRSIDHLTPVKKGGDNQIYNLVWACRSCNSKKHTTPYEEFMIKIQKPIDKWEFVFTTALVLREKIKFKNGE